MLVSNESAGSGDWHGISSGTLTPVDLVSSVGREPASSHFRNIF